MKLNLGAGRKILPNYVNVDKFPAQGIDFVLDLDYTPWHPWANDSIDHIVMHHVLEHLGPTSVQFLSIIGEIYRILKPNGEIEIIVPHHRSDNFAGDPTHIRPITAQMLGLFSKKYCAEAAQRGWASTLLADHLSIDLELISTNYSLTEYWGEKLRNKTMTPAEIEQAIFTFNNVVADVTIVLRKPGAIAHDQAGPDPE